MEIFKSITLSTIMGLLMIVGTGKAQTIDMERMNRDIKIAEDILSTLIRSENRGYFFGSNVEGNYLEGYGVTFSLPNNSFMVKTNDMTFVKAPRGESFSYSITTDEDDDQLIMVQKEKIKDEMERMGEEMKRVKKEQMRVREDQERMRARREEGRENRFNWGEESNARIEEGMKTFLVDYADLIGQLKPSDKIIITTKGRNEIWFENSNGSRTGKTKSAEIQKSDLIAYKKGETSREEALEKVVIKNKEVDTEKEKDLEIFSGIIARLYEPDFSQTYYTMRHTLNYERLESFGVIFSMKVYSSNSNDGLHSIRTTRESGLSQQERDKKVEAMYPDFEKSLIENILDYGRTIKSIKPDESLMFKVKLTECNGCDMPKSIEVTVRASVLSDYNAGKVSRDKAVNLVKVKKNN
ncbi:MAG: hypothetical protein OEX22_07200 [Cyclobacteriaceae bacterium]|nr:hypothetical protein [Cyclobacteriaceae bacterium]